MANHLSHLIACAALISLSGLAAAEENKADQSTSSRDAVESIYPPPSSCQDCHHYPDQFSHPVDMVPSLEIPQSLPLADGRMTCLTCHDVDASIEHGWGDEGDQVASPMLRGAENTQQLCTQCHSADSDSKIYLHALALGKAHLNSKLGEPALNESIDEHSASCLSCHDGSVTAGETSHITIGSKSQRAILGRQPLAINGSHPIGVDYDMARRTSPGAVLKHRTELDPRIRLFNSQVGCGSCHSLYSQQKAKLVMSNLGSSLCLSCHDF